MTTSRAEGPATGGEHMTQTAVKPTTDELKEQLRAQGVKYFFGAYVDIHGVPKSKAVPIDHLESALRGSELYTVGALEGMGELGPNEDECVGIPDAGNVVVLPWDRRFAIAPAELLLHGEPYSHDSRYVLRRQIEAAHALGYTFNLGIEPEVYVLRKTESGGIVPFVAEDLLNAPTRGYDIETTMLADPFLEPMVAHINELGWDVYSFDHEGGDGQYEFDFAYTDGLRMCDRMLIFRLMAKHVARTLGCFATFMPKPFVDSFASGAHLNMSLADETGENQFVGRAGNASSRDPGYTDLAYHFTAGVLRHADAITALACPTVNSYKRLLPYGFMREITWAPVYAAYGENNRTLMCRLPVNRRALELRTADSGCNFYLVTALTLAAGLEGVRGRLDPGDPVNADTYKVMEDPQRRDSLHRLPRTLGEAVDAFAHDELAREVLGPEFHTTYTEYKRAEWETYNTIVTEWEREQYLQLW
jgi:glutamine synthetase